ncbi:hypothetical protein JKP88DRAFT_353418 [Tribonema minus]|uniref:Arrestin-like N-terminal domain-containing protein n=1 Tax=Tribonema minus TaxID=303371 RepID=A0A835Z668_9STRA|nr:hypothetical protein JKP88DRAFT_353418 [Tribonema minus]
MANTFTIFNIGGPGWFHDVFEVQIVVDTDLSFQDPSDRFIVPSSAHHPDKPTPIVDCTTAIRGNIIVKAPPGHKVYYEGVSLKLTEYCATLSPAATTELASHAHPVIGPGSVEGSVYIPFSLDAIDARALRETYPGRLFALRHTLTATVARPRWTFPVVAHQAVALQRPGGAGAAAAAAAAAPAPLPGLRSAGGAVGVAEPRTLRVDACGGRCTFAAPSGVFALDEDIAGDFVVDNLAAPGAAAAALLLVELEGVGGAYEERVALAHPLFGALTRDVGAAPAAPGAAAAAAAAPGAGSAPTAAAGDAILAAEAGSNAVPPGGVTGTHAPQRVAVALARAPLHPTFAVSVEQGGRACELRYLLRLVVEDDGGRTFTDATEVVLYRRRVSANVRPRA